MLLGARGSIVLHEHMHSQAAKISGQLCSAPLQDSVTFTGGMSTYQSSENVIRKFCKTCGTPLVYHSTAEQVVMVSTLLANAVFSKVAHTVDSHPISRTKLPMTSLIMSRVMLLRQQSSLCAPPLWMSLMWLHLHTTFGLRASALGFSLLTICQNTCRTARGLADSDIT